MIPYGKQTINQQDIDAVIEVLTSDFITQGPKVAEFEESLIRYTRVNYAVAVNSATSALHLSCLALGLGAGDWLWTTPITFVASANCGRYCGANIDFVDINPETYNLCPLALEQKLINAKNQGKLPKIVIPVHLSGQSCDMEAIHRLSKEYGFAIIEDASHAIGGKYQDQVIGNCRYSDITVFSFHPVKIITTAEGGAALTNNDSLAKTMALLRSHGITRDPVLMTHSSDNPWYYQQIDLGYNFRMTDLHAALGCSQMQRLDSFIEQRHALAKRYNEKLKMLPIKLPYQDQYSYSSFHLYIICLELENIQLTHKQVFIALRNKGIGVNLHYIPVHTQPYYSDLGFNTGDFPNAEQYYSQAITIPLFASMTTAEQDAVIDNLVQVLTPRLTDV